MALFKTFGSNPSGEKLTRMRVSANYQRDFFSNLSETPMLLKGQSYLKLIWRFLNKPKATVPPQPLPSIKTKLAAPTNGRPVIIWLGHSSYFIHIDGKNILVDPVLSGYASPFSFTTRSFKGADIYKPADIPEIDVLVLTHDHYDHLDYHAVVEIQPRVGAICTSLGVGAHLQHWGVAEEKIVELDWWQHYQFAGGLGFTAAPARHFSGRTFVRNKTLWSSFVLDAGGFRLYLGGDSGYDKHFETIGDKFGPFDIAMLESGQYNMTWPNIHMMPEETVQAAIDLHSKVLLPVHWSKFALAMHPWDEPVKRVLIKAKEVGLQVTTPMIGEPVIPGERYPDTQWWNAVSGH